MTFVGPSKCDEYRRERERELNDVWNNLVSSEAFLKTHLVFGEAIDLFREALSCYQNGAYKATCVMCRSTTECAVYFAVTRQDLKYSESWKTIHESNTIPLDDDRWQSLIKEVKGMLDDNMMEILKKIRERGNFVAHYGSKRDKLFEKHATKVTYPSTLARDEEYDRIISKIVFDKETALKTLKDSQRVLKFLVEKILSTSTTS